MKIIVTIPTKGKWKLKWSGKGKHFQSVATLYNGIERRLLNHSLGSQKQEKLVISVKYPDGTANESLASNDRRYLLFTLACFLEDSLSEDTLKTKYKLYKQK